MCGERIKSVIPYIMMFALLATAVAEPTTATAGAAATVASAATEKQQAEPTTITADSAEFDQKTQMALLSGNVYVVHQGMELWADRVDVKMDAENQVEKMVATGKIVIKRTEGTATCGRAEYDAKSGILKLTEKPVLQQGPNLLEAPLIKFNQTAGKFQAEGGTRMRFIQNGEDDPVSKALREKRGTTEKP